MSEGISMDEDTSRIPYLIETLFDEINHLHATASSLGVKLSSILKDVPESDSVDQEVGPENQSQLASQILEAGRRVRHMDLMLQALIDRSEL